jgi:chemotaxis protein methyltransferase CheR
VPGTGADAVGPLVTRAHALLDEAQPTEALSLATQALSLDPENTEARLVAAFSLADLGELDDAVAQAEAVLEERPLTAAARYILGVIHQQRGDMDAALSEFRRTVYVDKDFVLAHFSIANIHRASGDMVQACREYENTLRALRATPEGPWTLFLGGFQPDILARVCERSLLECGRGADAKEPQLKRRY